MPLAPPAPAGRYARSAMVRAHERVLPIRCCAAARPPSTCSPSPGDRVPGARSIPRYRHRRAICCPRVHRRLPSVRDPALRGDRCGLRRGSRRCRDESGSGASRNLARHVDEGDRRGASHGRLHPRCRRRPSATPTQAPRGSFPRRGRAIRSRSPSARRRSPRRSTSLARAARARSSSTSPARPRTSIPWPSAPLRSPGGAAGFILVTFDDVSDRLAIARMRADFVANASHELRTPLASLTGFIETLLGPARNDPQRPRNSCRSCSTRRAGCAG